MIDHTALKTLIESLPEASAHVESGNHVAIAALLAALSEQTVSRGVLSRSQFAGDFIHIIARMRLSTDAGLRAKWDGYLGLLNWNDAVNLDAVFMQQIVFPEVVADGLATQAELDALTLRRLSVAEAALGPGTLVSHHDVGIALREEPAEEPEENEEEAPPSSGEENGSDGAPETPAPEEGGA